MAKKLTTRGEALTQKVFKKEFGLDLQKINEQGKRLLKNSLIPKNAEMVS